MLSEAIWNTGERMQGMDKIIEVSGLKKSFGAVEAVRGIDFYVERGSFLKVNISSSFGCENIIKFFTPLSVRYAVFWDPTGPGSQPPSI